MIDKKYLGQRIRNIRLERGLTTKEFGVLVGNATDSNVSSWEKGRTSPNAKRLKKIADLGSISVEELTSSYSKDTIKDMIISRFKVICSNMDEIARSRMLDILKDHSDTVNANIDKFADELMQSYYSSKSELVDEIDEFINNFIDNNPTDEWEMLDELYQRVNNLIDWLNAVYGKGERDTFESFSMVSNDNMNKDIYDKIMTLLNNLNNEIDNLLDNINKEAE